MFRICCGVWYCIQWEAKPKKQFFRCFAPQDEPLTYELPPTPLHLPLWKLKNVQKWRQHWPCNCVQLL